MSRKESSCVENNYYRKMPNLRGGRHFLWRSVNPNSYLQRQDIKCYIGIKNSTRKTMTKYQWQTTTNEDINYNIISNNNITSISDLKEHCNQHSICQKGFTWRHLRERDRAASEIRPSELTFTFGTDHKPSVLGLWKYISSKQYYLLPLTHNNRQTKHSKYVISNKFVLRISKSNRNLPQ